ncbi:hypothetical protein EV126DRAFT_209312 [Verticillium dahliae]|nr:hypothetical protein EV126DRAFT_209312 [Verticillium dahliae]
MPTPRSNNLKHLHPGFFEPPLCRPAFDMENAPPALHRRTPQNFHLVIVRRALLAPCVPLAPTAPGSQTGGPVDSVSLILRPNQRSRHTHSLRAVLGRCVKCACHLLLPSCLDASDSLRGRGFPLLEGFDFARHHMDTLLHWSNDACLGEKMDRWAKGQHVIARHFPEHGDRTILLPSCALPLLLKVAWTHARYFYMSCIARPMLLSTPSNDLSWMQSTQFLCDGRVHQSS